jgi:hypothetical protein
VSGKDTLFAVTAGEESGDNRGMRINGYDGSGNIETRAAINKSGNVEMNMISEYRETTTDARGGGGESLPEDGNGNHKVEEYIRILTPNGPLLVPGFRPPDTIDPAEPTNVSAEDNSNENAWITVSWDKVTEDEDGNSDETVDHYNVYRSPDDSSGSYVKIGESSTGNQAYLDTGVTAGNQYWYKVGCVDAAGNNSGKSSSKDSAYATEDPNPGYE